MSVFVIVLQGVVKNIIPAIASTNALIAAACVKEAVKLVSLCSQTLNNYFMFIGGAGAFTNTSTLERKPVGECMACRQPRKTVTVARSQTLQQVIQGLKEDSAL